MNSLRFLSLICIANAVCAIACSDGSNSRKNLQAMYNAADTHHYSNVHVVEIAGESANIALSESLSKKMLEEIFDKRNYKQDILDLFQRPLFICFCDNYKIVWYMTHIACYDNKTGNIIESNTPLSFDLLRHSKEWDAVWLFATEIMYNNSEHDIKLYKSNQRRTREIIISFLNSEQAKYK